MIERSDRLRIDQEAVPRLELRFVTAAMLTGGVDLARGVASYETEVGMARVLARRVPTEEAVFCITERVADPHARQEHCEVVVVRVHPAVGDVDLVLSIRAHVAAAVIAEARRDDADVDVIERTEPRTGAGRAAEWALGALCAAGPQSLFSWPCR